MDNRRNYYRILHVQPDAPLALIKASYKTLMQTLKQHPDLGGETWQAALINEAYATLSDPKKRQAYDNGLAPTSTNTRTQEQVKKPHFCAFCKTPYLDKQQNLCNSCQTPLQVASHWPKNSGADKRDLYRYEQGGPARLYTHWPAQARHVELLDLSPKGCGFICPWPLLKRDIVKLEHAEFSAATEIVNCQAITGPDILFHIGTQFKTIKFNNLEGNFFSGQT